MRAATVERVIGRQRSKWERVAGLLILAGAAAACRHHVESVPSPVPSDWHHCWWTVIRSTLPHDSVAARYRRAFVTAGMPNLHWTRSGDTIWVRAGPAPLPPSELPFDTSSHRVSYWSRLVAFQQGDSTRFRIFVAIVPPAGAWAQAADSMLGGRSIGICQEIAQAASVRWIRRAGDPGEEEKLTVWTRVP